MSSSTAMSRDSTAGLGASALVPFTATWIDNTLTTTATLIGQILDNGKTNWVGYNNGDAYYLLQTSESGAEQTTLADGQIFYVSSGEPPAGYLATDGAGSGAGEASASGSAATGGSGSGGSSASETAPSSASASTTPSSSSDDSSSGSGGSSSDAAEASASASSTPNSGYRLTLSTAFVVTCGLLAVFAL